MEDVQSEQRGGIANGRRPQDKAADHGKDGGVCADAEADGEDGDGCGSAMPGESAKRIGNVAEERLDPGESAALAVKLSNLLRTSEANESLTAGLFRVESGTESRIGVQGNMRFKLGSEVGFMGSRGKKSG
jgi:hypothetical protein